MARTSKSARLTVVPLTTNYRLPKPRSALSLPAKALFAEIVESAPPDHFRESDSPLLEQYANAILNAREAQRMVDKHGLVHGMKMSPWALALERSQKLIVALALRLRLSPQSRMDRKSKALSDPAANDPRRPWMDVDADGELD
jgi:Phage terminase, small subunit